MIIRMAGFNLLRFVKIKNVLQRQDILFDNIFIKSD